MSQHPSAESLMPAYEAPRNVQFSVFLDNRVGKLLELANVFEGQALRVASLNVLDSTDHAVIRVITSNADLCRRLLKRAEIPYSEADVLIVELDEERHSLKRLCMSLTSAELSIAYMYPLMVRPHNHPALVVYTDDQILAGQILRRKLFTLLAENDLGENLNPGELA